VYLEVAMRSDNKATPASVRFARSRGAKRTAKGDAILRGRTAQKEKDAEIIKEGRKMRMPKAFSKKMRKKLGFPKVGEEKKAMNAQTKTAAWWSKKGPARTASEGVSSILRRNPELAKKPAAGLSSAKLQLQELKRQRAMRAAAAAKAYTPKVAVASERSSPRIDQALVEIQRKFDALRKEEHTLPWRTDHGRYVEKTAAGSRLTERETDGAWRELGNAKKDKKRKRKWQTRAALGGASLGLAPLALAVAAGWRPGKARPKISWGPSKVPRSAEVLPASAGVSAVGGSAGLYAGTMAGEGADRYDHAARLARKKLSGKSLSSQERAFLKTFNPSGSVTRQEVARFGKTKKASNALEKTASTSDACALSALMHTGTLVKEAEKGRDSAGKGGALGAVLGGPIGAGIGGAVGAKRGKKGRSAAGGFGGSFIGAHLGMAAGAPLGRAGMIGLGTLGSGIGAHEGARWAHGKKKKKSSEKDKKASAAFGLATKFGPGVSLGYSTGREAAGQAAAAVAPRGKRTRAETIARKASVPLTIGGALAGVYAARGMSSKRIYAKLLKMPKLSKGERDLIVDHALPAAAGMAGGTLTGVATGTAVGGAAHIKKASVTWYEERLNTPNSVLGIEKAALSVPLKARAALIARGRTSRLASVASDMKPNSKEWVEKFGPTTGASSRRARQAEVFGGTRSAGSRSHPRSSGFITRPAGAAATQSAETSAGLGPVRGVLPQR
jgi:hypothetical protein